MPPVIKKCRLPHTGNVMICLLHKGEFKYFSRNKYGSVCRAISAAERYAAKNS